MKIGFIGCGNMGGALARAAVKAMGPESILVTDAMKEKAETFANETGACAVSISELASACGYIFLGVKPQNMSDMLREIGPILRERNDRFVLVTMAAGIEMKRIREMAGSDYPIIRIMPNLAVSVGEGMVLWCSNDVTKYESSCFETILSKAGRLCRIEEKLIDAGSAISGCGPAYAFMFIEALADGGVFCGLKRDTAQLLAAQMLLGSAKLLLESGSHPGALKDAVCSPGGTTIAGVLSLEECSFRGDVSGAVLAAYNKTLSLMK